MQLTEGQILSFYEVLGPLGAGGMGEVYRARDTRLDREVALKVLPQEFAQDDERLRRFEREAKMLATLNHPNVAAIHGIDQIDQICILALELCEGATLADKIARGALPVDETVEICRQIAEGVEAAHEAGLIHRDLKPANVSVTKDGAVKVLDFGLAKPAGPAVTGGAGHDSALVTTAGKVLGTPSYLSPEQARDKTVDRRTDVWAFGCVLYECLTGRRAFEGASFPDLLASIVGLDPDWSALPRDVPAPLRELIERCLRKDPHKRMRDIGDARIALEELSDHRDEPAPTTASPRLVFGLALTTVIATAAAVYAWIRPGPNPTGITERQITSDIGFENDPSWSPENEFIAFSRMKAGNTDVYVMPVAGGPAERRAGALGDDGTPRWSPDGRYLAFVSGQEDGVFVSLIAPHGGQARRLVATGIPPLDFQTRGYAMGDRPWSPDSRTLLFSGALPSGELAVHRVDRETGKVVQLTFPPAGSTDLSASLSFDGEEVVFERRLDGRGTLWIVPATGGAPRELLLDRFDNKSPAWRPGDEKILFRSNRGGAIVHLWELDERGGVPRQVTFGTTGVWAFSVSTDDRVACSRFWHDTFLYSMNVETGEEEQLTSFTGENFGARYSPDGTKIAYHSTRTGNSDIWLHDVETSEATRVTDHPSTDVFPDWSPGGEKLVFLSNREGAYKLFVSDPDGGRLTRLVDQSVGVRGSNPTNAITAARWSPDGSVVGYVVEGEEGSALWTVGADGAGASNWIDDVYDFDWHPDGRHVICMRQSSPKGGMMLLAIDPEGGREELLFEGPHMEIDVAPDGSAVAFCGGPAHLGMKPHVLALSSTAGGAVLKAVGEPRALYPLDANWHVHNGGWSPDSKKLVFTHDTDYGDLFEVIEKR